jgi:hypothetical protein
LLILAESHAAMIAASHGRHPDGAADSVNHKCILKTPDPFYAPIKSGWTPETPTISKAMTIYAYGGPVTIGQ